MSLKYTLSLVSTIIFCSFTTSSEISKFQQDICKIQDIFFKKNDYNERFINKCVRIFLNKVFIHKRIVQTSGKK